MRHVDNQRNLIIPSQNNSLNSWNWSWWKKKKTKDNKFLRKQTWNAGQSHSTDEFLCWSCQKTIYRQTVETLSGEKIEKKKKKERESDVWNFLGLGEGSGNLQLKNDGKTSATTAEKTAFTRTPTLASQYEKTRESRFAPNLLPYTARSREIFSSREWVVNMVYARQDLVTMEPVLF